jgi:FkbM family methyltransferase
MSLWVDPNARDVDRILISRLLREGDVYFDIGANIGHLAIEAGLKVSSKGKVFAYEPHPRISQFLLENVELNGLHNVSVAQVAVGDRNGWIRFTDVNSDDLNRIVKDTSSDSSFSVLVVRLEPYIDELASIRLLKIDVEGFEAFVLQGCGRSLTKVQYIYFEVWDAHLEHAEIKFVQIYDLLQEEGFYLGQADLSTQHLSHVRRDDCFPNVVNLIAYRDEAELLSLLW